MKTAQSRFFQERPNYWGKTKSAEAEPGYYLVSTYKNFDVVCVHFPKGQLESLSRRLPELRAFEFFFKKLEEYDSALNQWLTGFTISRSGSFHVVSPLLCNDIPVFENGDCLFSRALFDSWAYQFCPHATLFPSTDHRFANKIEALALEACGLLTI